MKPEKLITKHGVNTTYRYLKFLRNEGLINKRKLKDLDFEDTVLLDGFITFATSGKFKGKYPIKKRWELFKHEFNLDKYDEMVYNTKAAKGAIPVKLSKSNNTTSLFGNLNNIKLSYKKSNVKTIDDTKVIDKIDKIIKKFKHNDIDYKIQKAIEEERKRCEKEFNEKMEDFFEVLTDFDTAKDNLKGVGLDNIIEMRFYVSTANKEKLIKISEKYDISLDELINAIIEKIYELIF